MCAVLSFHIGIRRNCTGIPTFFCSACYLCATELSKISTEFALIIEFLMVYICYEVYYIFLCLLSELIFIGKKGPFAPLPSLLL